MTFGKWILLTIHFCNNVLYLFIYLYTPADGLQAETYSVIVTMNRLLYYIYVPIVHNNTSIINPRLLPTAPVLVIFNDT
jgi:hypothetical protein